MVSSSDTTLKKLDKNISKLIDKVISLEDGLEEVKEKVKFLPTTEKYLASQDKLAGELKKATEAVKLTGQHYKDTNKRVDKIDKYLGIDTMLQISPSY